MKALRCVKRFLHFSFLSLEEKWDPADTQIHRRAESDWTGGTENLSTSQISSGVPHPCGFCPPAAGRQGCGF